MRSRSRRRLALALAVVSLLLTGCFGDGADLVKRQAAGASEQALPEWLNKVYPADGSETTATRAIEVRHNVVSPQERLRLVVDGVDVTTYAREGRGLLVYDADQANTPVELSPGTHRATLEYIRVPEDVTEPPPEHDVLGTYNWTFELS